MHVCVVCTHNVHNTHLAKNSKEKKAGKRLIPWDLPKRLSYSVKQIHYTHVPSHKMAR